MQNERWDLPTVSVIIPFHNEERWVVPKIENTLASTYPMQRFEVIAVSDGSTDRTPALLKRYEGRIRRVVYGPRQGKPTALNRGVSEAKGEILVFTDANVLVAPDAIGVLAQYYKDPSVGAVSGNVALQPEGSCEPLGEGLYMRYERWLFELESRANTMVGADGALCSVRRHLFMPLASDAIVDDFEMALGVVAQGRRVMYAPAARGVEVVRPDVRAEFRRKVRMIAGGYQAIWRFRHLLNPFKYPVVAFQLLSHKLLRWMVPLFLAAALIASVTALQHPLLAAAAAAQGCFYTLALMGWASSRLRCWMPVYVPYYFCAVNVAAALGLWRYLTGRQSITWEKVQR